MSNLDESAVAQAAAVLKAGGLVALPTETVYGLGADARNETAVARVFSAKRRPADHPLIVHLASADDVGQWASDVPAEGHKLAALFWPGPLTLVFKRRPGVSPLVTGGFSTIALRVPDHPVALAVLNALGSGIAAPSANRFGRISPTTAADVVAELGADVDHVLDGGPCRIGVESTIVDLSGPQACILRPGGLARERLEQALGRKLPVRGIEAGVRVPGQHPVHYAPRAELRLVLAGEVAGAAKAARAQGRKVAVLTLGGGQSQGDRDEADLWLALPDAEAGGAARLYPAFREADAHGVDLLLAVPPPGIGLGLAIVDRLTRAAGPRLP